MFVNVGVFQNRKVPFVKPIARKQASVDHVTGDKLPKSFVFSRGKLPGVLRQLQMDMRKLMLPYTALKLKVRLCLFVGSGIGCRALKF